MTVFEKLASEIGLGPVTTEYKFADEAIGRKWAFDYAFPESMVALEVDGGVWTQGRHTRGKGFIADQEKRNEATILGWRVIHCTPQQRDDGSILETLRRLV